MLTPYYLALSFAFIISVSAQAKQSCNDAPAMQKDPSECCTVPNLITATGVTDNCLRKLSGPQPPVDIELQQCACECFLNETKVFSGGSIDQGAAQKYFLKSVNAVYSNTVAATATITKCVANTNKKVQDFSSLVTKYRTNNRIPATQLVCSPMAEYFFSCIYNDILINCPADKSNKSPECAALKDYIAKNDCVFPFYSIKH